VEGTQMRIEYDDEVDAIYVHVREGAPVARSEILEDGRVVDLDVDGHLIGSVRRSSRTVAWSISTSTDT